MAVVIEGPPQGASCSRDEVELLAKRGEHVLSALGHPQAELSLSLVDDPTIEALNAADRGRPRPTDVLSYSLIEGEHAEFRGRLLGDVVISVDTAKRQAEERSVSLGDELSRLMIHGVLHLLGHDHEEEAEAREMRALEEELWQGLRP